MDDLRLWRGVGGLWGVCRGLRLDHCDFTPLVVLSVTSGGGWGFSGSAVIQTSSTNSLCGNGISKEPI